MSVSSSLKNLQIGMAFGMQAADREMTSQPQASSSHTLTQRNQANSLMQDLKNGRVTQEVEKFRYHHYMILREAEKKQRNKEHRNIWDLQTDMTDSQYPVELGIPVKTTGGGMEEQEGTQYSNIVLDNRRSNINLSYYANRIIVRDMGSEYGKIVEIWVNKYQLSDPTADYVVRQLSQMVGRPNITDLTAISKCAFVTQNQFGWEDFRYFAFIIKALYNVVEYGNHIILKYIQNVEAWNEDTLDGFFNQEVADGMMSAKVFGNQRKTDVSPQNLPYSYSNNEIKYASPPPLSEIEQLREENRLLRQQINEFK